MSWGDLLIAASIIVGAVASAWIIRTDANVVARQFQEGLRADLEALAEAVAVNIVHRLDHAGVLNQLNRLDDLGNVRFDTAELKLIVQRIEAGINKEGHATRKLLEEIAADLHFIQIDGVRLHKAVN